MGTEPLFLWVGEGGIKGRSTRAQDSRGMLCLRRTRELLYVWVSRTVVAAAESQNKQSKNFTHPNNKPALL